MDPNDKELVKEAKGTKIIWLDKKNATQMTVFKRKGCKSKIST